MPTQESKSFQLSFKNERGYLLAEISGKKDSFNISINYWNEVFKRAENCNQSRILVLENFENQLSASDMHKACIHISNLFVQHPCKIAFIDNEDKHDELNEFGELIVQNRGGQIKVFNNKKNAVHWLKN